jgi:alpha-N-arabinofuranosidase
MAIPEFILRKLIVPGSLRSIGTGFQFILLDTFAPATITSFKLIVGQKEIPASSISFSSPGINIGSAEAINKENPLLATVGTEVTLQIHNQPLNGPVKVIVDTKEIGKIEFTLADSLKKPHYKGFTPRWMSVFRKPIESNIFIDTNSPDVEVSPFLLGQFVEHLERCVYDGIWTKKGTALRADTLRLIEQLHIPMIRYPGGNFASGYHWEDGIDSRDNRPIRHDAAWQAEETNQVGTDEFLTFCEQMDIEPYLVVNDGSGTPEEAARWVAYCNNSPKETEQGHRRALNGHEQPYNVKYWGVGNEVWGPWQIGSASAQEYVHRLSRFSQAMRTVDPTIKIIAVGNNPLSDDPADPATLWNKEVLENGSDDFDFLSCHIYQPEQESWKESYDPHSLFAAVCAAPVDFENIIKRVGAQIGSSKGKNRITQCIDEWNIWLPPGERAKSMHQVTFTMRDCLYVAGIINALYRNSALVDIANLAQLVNVLPLIKTTPTKAIATAIFFPFVLAAEMEENLLAIKVNSPAFESEGIGKNLLAHQNVPYLDATATQDKEGEAITVLIINRHPEDRMNLTITLSGNRHFSSMSRREISAISPLSFNSFEHPKEVRIHNRSSLSLKENKISFLLSPASVTLCKFTK